MRVLARDRINSVLSIRGYELRHVPYPLAIDEFLDLQTTLTRAKDAGLSVGDYLDVSQNQAGTTQETIDRLAALGVFGDGVRRVCEIGPGSGRYLEKTIALCKPEHYEIYETSRPWRDWLSRRYPVVVRPTDGRALTSTPSASIDVVHAHKVFSGIAAMKAVRYMVEMMRVVGPGGKIAFDVVTEDCLDQPVLNEWLRSSNDYDTYPAFMPKQFVLDLFARGGFSLVGNFIVSMKPGVTQYLAFSREAVGQHS